MIEFRKTIATPESTSVEEAEPPEEDSNNFELETSDLYLYIFIAASSILIITIIISICVKLFSRNKSEHGDNINSDKNLLKRLDSVRQVNDPKYKAKSLEEIKRIVAEQMEKQEGAAQESESEDLDEEEQSQPSNASP